MSTLNDLNDRVEDFPMKKMTESSFKHRAGAEENPAITSPHKKVWLLNRSAEESYHSIMNTPTMNTGLQIGGRYKVNQSSMSPIKGIRKHKGPQLNEKLSVWDAMALHDVHKYW